MLENIKLGKSKEIDPTNFKKSLKLQKLSLEIRFHDSWITLIKEKITPWTSS